MPTFEFLRLSLSVPIIGDLAKEDHRQEPDMTRKEFLTEAFSKRRDFFYKKKLYSYVPIEIEIERQDSLVGFIGKPVEESVNAGPEQLFALTKSKHYKAAFLAIDVAKDKQEIAFEKRPDVGAAHGIIKAMLDSYIKSCEGFVWHPDIAYLSSEKDFWRVAKKSRGQITDLSFEFYPPNGLEAREALKEFHKMAKDEMNSETSKYSFKNKDGGISPEGDFVESAVDYATKGAGNITMKGGRKTLFSSKKERQVKNASKSIVPRTGDIGGLNIIELFERLFGKKDD